MSKLDPSLLEVPALKMKVVGVGGAGNNAVDRLQLAQRIHLPLANLNTDYKSLMASPVAERLLIGREITGGLSAGYDEAVGKAAAEEAAEEIEKLLEGQDLVFLVAGLGGGTGSGAAPVVAEIASELGAMVIAFVTMPFSREGLRNAKRAENSLHALRERCHAVITLPNDLLLQEIDDKATLLDAFQLADDWIGRGVRAISSMLSEDGLINVDFAKLREAFSFQGGKTLFGFAEGEGADAVAMALRQLELCPLLHLPENRYIRETDSLILHIAGGPELEMTKVSEIIEVVTDRFRSKDQVVLGAVIEGSMTGKVAITVVGTTSLDRTKRAIVRPRRQLKRSPKVQMLSRKTDTNEHGQDTHETVQPQAVSSVAQPEPIPATNWVSSEPSIPSRKVASKTRDQEEFTFPSADENRGYFDKTEQNLYEGIDLDVPTYLRRGIKISLSVH